MVKDFVGLFAVMLRYFHTSSPSLVCKYKVQQLVQKNLPTAGIAVMCAILEIGLVHIHMAACLGVVVLAI